MEVMVAVRSGTLLRALGVQLKRRVSARRGGAYNEVLQAIQKKSRPSPSNFVAPSACKLLSEQGFGFRKANVVECRVFASHFPSGEVQGEAEVRGGTKFEIFGNGHLAGVKKKSVIQTCRLHRYRPRLLLVTPLSRIGVSFHEQFSQPR